MSQFTNKSKYRFIDIFKVKRIIKHKNVCSHLYKVYLSKLQPRDSRKIKPPIIYIRGLNIFAITPD